MIKNSSVRLCVVTPIANEAATIIPFLKAVATHLTINDKHLLIIDNVSRDETKNLVKHFISNQQYPIVELIEAHENRCIRDAYIRGYKEALNLGSKWILEMDAGFSHDPNDIPKFIEKMNQGFDYAGGSRFSAHSQYKGGIYRRILSQGGTLAAKAILGCKLTDMTSGFQCYTHQTLQYILDQGISSKGGFFQTEIRYWISKLNWTEIPIIYGNTKGSVPMKYVTDGVIGLFKLSTRHGEIRETTLQER